jgi:hypothetical protein
MRRGATTTHDEEAGDGVEANDGPELKRQSPVSERITFAIFLVILTASVVFLATVADPSAHKVHPAVQQQPLALAASVPSAATGVQQLQLPAAILPPPLPPTPTPTAAPSINKLAELRRLSDHCVALIKDVRALKHSGAVMEVDVRALAAVQVLQTALRQLLALRFGDDNPTILIEMLLTFPASMPDIAEKGAEGRVVIEMAPIAHAPYSVYNFLEVVRRFQSGAFHRNAGHVLQAMVNLKQPTSALDHFNDIGGGNLAFQEYSPEFPHKQYTLGYVFHPLPLLSHA